MSEQKTELTIIERACVALASTKAEQDLIELAGKSKQITVITSKDGRAECHTAAMAAKSARIVIEKAGKSAREDATAFSKAVVAEEKRLIDLIEPEEKRLITLRDEWDKQIEVEKAAKAEYERARIDGIKESIASIAAWPLNCVALPATVVAYEIERLSAIEIDDSFAEFFGDAADAKSASLAKLREMYDNKLASEAEVIRIAEEAAAHAEKMKAEREELQRLKAEAAERDRLAAEARATEDRLMQAQRAELGRQQKEIDDQRAKIEAQAKEAAAESERGRVAEIARLEQEAADAQALVDKSEDSQASQVDIMRNMHETLSEAQQIEERRRIAQCREQERPTATVAAISHAVPRPTRAQIIEAVAAHFKVSDSVSVMWLIAEFDESEAVAA